jgi:hypothetical protein
MSETATIEKTRRTTIDAKKAAQLAIEYFHELFTSSTISNIALEELEFSEGENCWLITLGFDETCRSNDPSQTRIPVVLRLQKIVRKYKIFKVNAKTGKVISMKIRSLE